ncbi:TraB/GumN family protein [Paenibacillus chitinolyticus]|uniref:TraB/GumN family protein n=1 Tax=Paenibacillus chitinolyticus TaxID=79263 RepID=UPI0038678C6D
MKSHLWSKWSRKTAAGLLGVTILLGGTNLTVRAEQAPAPTPSISTWSLSTLNEGEKYGIYPMGWYYDGKFQQAIDAAKFTSLIESTAAKLDQLGFGKKDLPLPVSENKVITRDTVMRAMYGLLARYELPASFGIGSSSPIEYLQQKGIVQGSSEGLELDQPCTAEQAAVLASRLVEFSYDTAGQGAKGVFWKVKHNHNTLYLLGSVHLGIPEMYPLQKNIREAFEASDDLWVEADTLSGDMSYFANLMVYDDGTKIQDHVSKETYEKLQKVLKKMEIPEQAFEEYKPFAVSSNLSMLSLFDQPEQITAASASGIDHYFLTKALLTGKPVHELEGIKLQADVFNSLSPEAQEKDLNSLLDTLLADGGKEGADSFKQLQLDWSKGDAKGVADGLVRGGLMEGELNKNLIGERDKNMAKKIADLLEKDGERTSFVVVGSAHYVVKDMVIDQLKAKGYDVQPVK